MVRALLRLVLAVAGACASAFFVALLEARTVVIASVDGGSAAPPLGALLLADLGVLLPVVLAVGGAVGVASVVLEPGVPRTPREHLADLRAGSVMERLRAATTAPLLVVAAFGWCAASAYTARAILATGKPAEAGLTIGLASVGLVALAFALAAAVAPWLRRLLAIGGSALPQLLDPVLTGGVALALVGLLFAVGVATGDTGGTGGLLGIFGVLKRKELDLRPVGHAALLALGAYGASVSLGRARFSGANGAARAEPVVSALGSGLLLVVLASLCTRAAGALGDEPLVSRGLEKEAPLGKLSLAFLRKLSDRDHDGASARFGGGDCNDHDARINPNALDVPGNGVDEDCSGADTPLAAPPTPDPKAAAGPDAGLPRRPRRTYNVLLITIDTLRVDLGFMGYPSPVSPNLDKLAERSVVFERAYSLASYTGKSIGPMLIGKYPSETLRDGGHFNTYFPPNVLVTERVKARGARTFAVHCHWYFRFPTGLNQGMDVWDVSAIPAGMGDNDTTVTSDRETAVALKLLGKPENVTPPALASGDAGAADAGGGEAGAQDAVAPGVGDGGLALAQQGAVASGASADEPRRFFGWLHYVDPHAQYVPHEGAPKPDGPPTAKSLYDGEVWYTDKYVGEVLDYVAEQPWAADTAIIVTADHGEAFADHGMSWHGAEIWESLVRVPLVVYVPGAKARRVPVKRSHIDLAPTILELMGAPLQGESDALRGKSLLEDVYAAGEHEERDVYIDMPPGPYNGLRRAVITGQTPGMKLIHQGGAIYQLFDLADDPGEKRDLAADRSKLGPAIERMNAIRSTLKEIEVKVEPP